MLTTETIKTRSRNEWVDITALVEAAVVKSGIKDGIVVVFCPHTTAGISINENADPTVPRDLTRKMSELIPQHDDYDHSEGNSDSHLKSSLVGAQETVIISNGKLLLGTWQSIYFCEFDGPRSRKIHIKVV
ncbi:MAG: YjbQ family protein [Fibrobacteres bacterium]|nr:YjbQ family protein [Fibrobacterota bacterium]